MKVKKIPLRTCVVTKEKLPKKELLRIVRTKEKTLEVDLTGKLNGRGAYIKKDSEVVMIAKNKKLLDRHLEVEVPQEFYDKILEVISEEENGKDR